MASTFVGAPTALRAQVAPRRGSRSTRALTRADAAAQASLAVTPATVGSRSGSASVKGTVRKQNEDRFASYVSYPPHRRDVGRPMPETLAPRRPLANPPMTFGGPSFYDRRRNLTHADPRPLPPS